MAGERRAGSCSMMITVQCIRCQEKRKIDEAECERLSREVSTPMCEKCSMPMVAVAAKVKRSAVVR